MALRHSRAGQKRTFVIFIAFAAVLVITTVISTFLVGSNPDTLSDDPKEAAAQTYLNYLSDPEAILTAKNNGQVYCASPGMGTGDDAAGDAQADAIALQYQIANEQHELIDTLFGEEAWDNVTYTFEEIEPIDGREGYRLRASGEVITEEKYNEVMGAFWQSVAEQENVTVIDLFTAEGSASGSGDMRTDLIEKYKHEVPAEIALVSENTSYRVQLSFGTPSEEGYEEFSFLLYGADSTWQIHQGLTWQTDEA